jgi:hypothetical protein
MRTNRACSTCAACGGAITGSARYSATGRPFHDRCWGGGSSRPSTPTAPSRGGPFRTEAELWRYVADVERRARERSRMCPNPYDPLSE